MAVAIGVTHDGDFTNGTVFHIGHGYFVTANHVARLMRLELRTETLEQPRILTTHDSAYGADVSILETDWTGDDYLVVGTNWDDVGPDSLVGAPVVLLGYPPIPKADRAVLVVAPGHLSAIIDRYDGVPHAHYITSVAPRAGFSGAPLVAAWDEAEPWVMGVFVESLTRNNQPSETGFGAAISIDPIWNIVDRQHVKPPGTAWLDEFE